MRVLVTSSRNTFALDIIRKLGSLGHTVIASDTSGGAIGSHSKYLAGHVVTASPRFETDRFIAEVNAAVLEHEIDIILPMFEEAFYLAARAGDLPDGVKLYTGAFSELARLHDKASFQRLAEQADVPIPETVVVTSDAELAAAIDRFPQFFARAAFSRGGVGLLTNTGPLAGKISAADCHPTPEQPWLVQPFVDGPMICTFSTVVDGRVTAHCTYSAPTQWEHSTGISFLAIDSTDTLRYTQRLIDELDSGFTGLISFDFVDHDGELFIIECNPRPTNGVILLEADAFADALTGAVERAVVVEPGLTSQVQLAVIAEAFTEPLSKVPAALQSALRIKDVGAGWHDNAAMLWGLATLWHGAELDHGSHKEIMAALAEDIVWNGEPIEGMSQADADALEAVHAQRV